MKSKTVTFLLSFITGLSVCCAIAYAMTDTVRVPAVAGTFYPKDPGKLRKMINGFLEQVPERKINGTIVAIISPHAGYVYSGPIAAYAYKTVKDKQYDTVVVLALSHFVPFRGASVFDGEYYETPLGKVPIDTKIVKDLIENNKLITFNKAVHQKEHSLEVQVPFLQTVLHDFNIVPILLGDRQPDTVEAVTHALKRMSESRNILVVASTDLSHYHPYETAVRMDTDTVNAILNGDSDSLSDYFNTHGEYACGQCPLVTVLAYAEKIGANHIELLKYANSGDTQGDKNRVVGYSAFVITKEGEEHMSNNSSSDEQVISEASKKELFEIVRTTIKSHLITHKLDDLEITNPELQGKNGVFVTLKTKSGALRGCIGCFEAEQPLYKTVQQFALAAAFRDPRFSPVTAKELDDLNVEISILSPMRKISDPKEIKLGTHGIYIKKGFHSGTFLPQVATETNWSLEEFLGHCSRDKAGLGWDGWKNADIYVYTAKVIDEEE